ncbi:hypothetical protein Val02_89590 [Virgisporangium aliadipatigenens]|uniref:PKD domain containing protein n=1 Tax=Virgisporangium aliadipatigenens TaxID=741659 RepID=A0A8J3YYT1_9ACTN|nr:PKD domain containing protein [Virgisporangium aliadipatigenens]GIJ52073.1 hypothetical protein Val02_89590 [Virgisporangium aliadipatigenens]
MRRPPLIAAATVAVLSAALLAGAPARADLAQPAQVSANPVDYTPHVLEGTVHALALVGETVVVGGDFSEIADASGKNRAKRTSIFAYNLRTGAVNALATRLDGMVLALTAGPNNTVYVGGDFKRVNGVAQRGITQLNVADGSRVEAFTARIGHSDVRALSVSGPWLYVGGTFTSINGVERVALGRVNPTTGATDTAWNPGIAAPHLDRAKVEDFAISPNGQRLVAIGAIEHAAGQYRAQVAMFDLTPAVPTLVDWYTDAYSARCLAGFDTYLRGVDFAPDSSYFVLVTTGRDSHPKKTCDTAARFETAGTGMRKPTWVNHTGGDSLYSVSVTGSTVYVGGHQRWQNNPFGRESKGKGAVSREGIAALDPVTGLATDWNPGRARGVGVKALLSTPAGLIVGSDTERLAREYHGRIGMFPPA